MDSVIYDLQQVNFRVHDENKIHHTKEQLIILLNRSGVQWNLWSPPHHKTLNDLLDLINNHQVELVMNNGRLSLIKIHITIVFINYHQGSRRYRLTETLKEKTKTAQQIKRRGKGIGYYVKDGELADATARRALQERLGFTDPQDYSLSRFPIRNSWTSKKDSEKWPGVSFMEYQRVFRCTLFDSLYDPQGYIYTNGDWKTYFIWK